MENERPSLVRFVFLLCLVSSPSCLESYDQNDTASVYIVTLKKAPSSHSLEEQLRRAGAPYGSKHAVNASSAGIYRPWNISRSEGNKGGASVAEFHESLLRKVLKGENYLKLYSYHYLINGFAAIITQHQADRLAGRREVANVVLDFPVKTATSHTPQFLGLPRGVWGHEGGPDRAGEGIVIGFIDTGIDPSHPSFSDKFGHQYPIPPHFSGVCEITKDFPADSCNKKLIGARHFAASAITRGIFNSSQDYASPFDGDGHGTHTASVAVGNHGIPVVVSGHHFGNASGMAPRAHLAVYKALYKRFGGFAADVIAAIDQAGEDGVDIINLSITPNRRPPGIATFFNPIDMALLSAVKAGIFVVQAAGNTGPAPKTMSSFSPWIFTVGATSHDRLYTNSILLGNNVTISGLGLASGMKRTEKLVLAVHALRNGTTETDNIYVGECQDSDSFDRNVVRGKVLMCSYTVRFILGVSTIKKAVETARSLCVSGLVFYMDSSLVNYQLGPTPMDIPGIIIPSPEDSKVLLEYYNSSLLIENVTRKIIGSGGVGRIAGGVKPTYGNASPKVMYFSARGPDPEDDSFENADIMKPNLVAPGNSIWGAWSPLGIGTLEFEGESFAMVSGTSMAAPHVAGIAALIKQKFPQLSTAAIGSVLSTTATSSDIKGDHIMAQRSYASPDVNQSPATPFDMGSGFINATAALDPGLVLDTGFNDYMSFLCGINGSSQVVLNYTGERCSSYNASITAVDLNLPSITIAKLVGTRTVLRTVTNIAMNETYNVGYMAPDNVSVKVSPTRFSITNRETRVLRFVFRATKNVSVASFGKIRLLGDRGHVLNIPLAVIFKSV